MQWKLLNDTPLRTYAVVLDSGDETVDCLSRFAREQHLHASQLSAIGAFRGLVLVEQGYTWAAWCTLGGIFVLVGAVCWSKRNP